MSIDTTRAKMTQVIGRILVDKAFRDSIQRDPSTTLGRMGIPNDIIAKVKGDMKGLATTISQVSGSLKQQTTITVAGTLTYG